MVQKLSPTALRCLSTVELTALAADIRRFLVDSVGRTGGHLGSNLGVVELTLALHRVFDSPRTPIVFDTGHQAYVHKLVTGRAVDFGSLRTDSGLSGYPNRTESAHDFVENSHASTALSYADGLGRAFALAGEPRPVVAVVGDGALTGGLAWEALNNLGVAGRPTIVVVNDNGRSYAPTIGGLSRHLRDLCASPARRELVRLLGGDDRPPKVAEMGNLFQALGLDYLGPIDGHDIAALETAFRHAQSSTGAVVVHCLTRKGRGHGPAEADLADHMHTIAAAVSSAPDSGFRAGATNRPVTTVSQSRPWTAVFGAALADLAEERPDLVAITAAMAGPTGLRGMAERCPDRVIDVGIAEQHAVASAAGLAMGGRHPVVALYATFANRAFDQTLLDVGLHRLPVTFVLDRAGITGPDGPSHHGIWDLALFGLIPGMRVAAPRDGATLTDLLAEAVAVNGPTMLRFPKGATGEPIPAVGRWGPLDLVHTGAKPEVLVIGVGAAVRAALQAAERLVDDGVECTVVDPRWVLPVSPHLVALAGRHRLVVTVEDGIGDAGVGTRVRNLLSEASVDVPTEVLALPQTFLPPGSRDSLLADCGLDSEGIEASIAKAARDRIPASRRRSSRAGSAGQRRAPLFVLPRSAR